MPSVPGAGHDRRRNPRHPETFGGRTSSRVRRGPATSSPSVVVAEMGSGTSPQASASLVTDVVSSIAVYESLPFMEKTYRGVVRPNLTMLFHFANHRFFDDEIKGFSVRYATNLLSSYGSTSKYSNTINISWKIHSYLSRQRFSTLMGSLIHEMVHAWLYLYCPRKCDEENENHGPLFMKKLMQISRRAAKFNYNLFTVPACQYRDLRKKIKRYSWECAKCGLHKDFLVSRNINGDPVLASHKCVSLSTPRRGDEIFCDDDCGATNTWIRTGQ